MDELYLEIYKNLAINFVYIKITLINT